VTRKNEWTRACSLVRLPAASQMRLSLCETVQREPTQGAEPAVALPCCTVAVRRSELVLSEAKDRSPALPYPPHRPG
jgi:hypothetical protein